MTMESFGQCTSSRREGIAWNSEPLKLPLNPTQKQTSIGIRVVIGMPDVATVRCHPSSQFAHQTGSVRTDQLQDHRRGSHGNALKS